MQLTEILAGVGREAAELAFIGLWFAALAWVVKRERALADARAALGETRTNLIVALVDLLAVAPLITLVTGAIGSLVQSRGFALAPPALWRGLGPVVTGLLAIFAADFAGYWRHRLQHSRWLWPAHAMHHSDTRLTWFSLGRLHPIDRLGSTLDILVMAVAGFPVWAISLAVLARHYYGYFIHADLPWTFGKAAWVMNSPAMHRWHHARDTEGSGANFATIFSVFDRAFGTCYAPGPCSAPLGVREPMGRGVLGQYLHPFRTWGAAAAQMRSRSHATRGASAGGIG